MSASVFSPVTLADPIPAQVPEYPVWVNPEHHKTLDAAVQLVWAVIKSVQADGGNATTMKAEMVALRKLAASLGYDRKAATALAEIVASRIG